MQRIRESPNGYKQEMTSNRLITSSKTQLSVRKINSLEKGEDLEGLQVLEIKDPFKIQQKGSRIR